MYELLQAQLRDRKKDPKPNRMRMRGIIPGIIYAKGIEPIELKIEEKDLRKCLSRCGQVLEVEVKGKGKHLVNLDYVQRHPLKQSILHISFLKLKQGQKTTVTLPLIMTGKSPGAKDGGVVTLQMNEIDVTGLPSDMPPEIEIDVSNLNINEHLTLKDIQVPKGLTIEEEDLEKNVVSCSPPRKEEPEPAPVEAADGEAGAEGGDSPAAAKGGGEETKEEKKE